MDLSSPEKAKNSGLTKKRSKMYTEKSEDYS